MSLYGLIGFPLQHTYSPALFREIFERNKKVAYRYEVIETPSIDHLKEIVVAHRLKGFNVTYPFKTAIIAQLDALDETAEMVGAVNTVCVMNEGDSIFLKGYNTDTNGFEKLFRQVKKTFKENEIRALILGTGGASRAVQHVLQKHDIEFCLVSRKPPKQHQIQYEMLSEYVMKKINLIINTTPLGMHPNADEFPPIPYEYLTKEHCLIDLIYNPETTEFLKRGIEKGCATFNGMEMLRQQAEAAYLIWTEKESKRRFHFSFW
ncbi:MAG: shikimate dehydrogenase [Lentimicrobiaceae bacterium]|jgi:shikimate dehydrogenase|nr:shikimate dehydrogenase [Lentimicrobiaceae bacterium]